jgi:hypothetical protein
MPDQPPDDHEHGDEFSLVTPFWIDTDGYSDRDRLMFSCGVEFQMTRELLATGDHFSRPIHAENESRLRMLCGRAGRTFEITQVSDQWSNLEVGPDLKERRDA